MGSKYGVKMPYFRFYSIESDDKKESHRTMKLFHGERIIASITHGSSLSVLRIWFMASLGQSRPLDMIRPLRTSSPNSDTPRILAEGHCLRAGSRPEHPHRPMAHRPRPGSGTVIMEVKDGPYEPTGEEDILG